LHKKGFRLLKNGWLNKDRVKESQMQSPAGKGNAEQTAGFV